jgi:hypothetical protein
MSKFTDTTYFSIQPDVLYTMIDDEAVLMRGQDNTLYGVNPVATEIWQQLNKKPMTLQMLGAHLIEHFDVKLEECIKDTAALLEKLLDENLIYILD